MQERLIGSGIVCKLLGIEPRTLGSWGERGIVRATVAPGGKGHHQAFAVPAVVAVAVVQLLSRGGHSLRLAEQAFAFLRDLSEADLAEHFRAGETNLLFVAGACFGLKAPAAIAQACKANKSLVETAAADVVLAVDVQRVHRAVLAAVRELDRASAEAPKQPPRAGRKAVLR